MRSILSSAVLLAFSLVLPSSLAQFPKQPEGVTVLDSRFGDGVQISYKEVSSLPRTDSPFLLC